MTAWDVLSYAAKLPHPVLVQKSGLTPKDYFVTQIDGLANEGSGNGKRNWLYWVDGKLAKQGVGTQPVKAGQTLLFKFAAWDPAAQP
jgi:hypothetical protein